MRTFGASTRGNAQLEGVIFGDGSVSVRRLSRDPCERITLTFEGVSECEAELDIKVPEAGAESARYVPGAYRFYSAEDNEPEPEDVG